MLVPLTNRSVARYQAYCLHKIPLHGAEIPVAREQRELAAIFAANVVGYSRAMECDESGKLAR